MEDIFEKQLLHRGITGCYDGFFETKISALHFYIVPCHHTGDVKLSVQKNICWK